MFDPLSALTIFGPVVVDGAKALINRFITPDNFKPSNIGEYLSIRNSELEMFKAMNEAGGSNSSYPWVEAIVRLMRPSIAFIVIGSWAGMHLSNNFAPEALAMVDNFAASVGFYLFGDRTLFYTAKGAKK